jgi:hypothetical protein
MHMRAMCSRSVDFADGSHLAAVSTAGAAGLDGSQNRSGLIRWIFRSRYWS